MPMEADPPICIVACSAMIKLHEHRLDSWPEARVLHTLIDDVDYTFVEIKIRDPRLNEVTPKPFDKN